MSENPINWDIFSTTVFTNQKARDSGIVDEDWRHAMDQMGLEAIALQQAEEQHGRVGRKLVTYEFTPTLGQFGVLIVEAVCYRAWQGLKNEIHTDREALLGQALIECVLTDPDTFQHVRDKEPDAPDATLKVFLHHKTQASQDPGRGIPARG